MRAYALLLVYSRNIMKSDINGSHADRRMRMKMIDSLKLRRSYYNINKVLPVEKEQVVDMIKMISELVPDAFNMKSAVAVVVFEDKHDLLWDNIYEVFAGKVSREKINSFKAGAGTILYFYDQSIVERMQQQFPLYADNFPIWANQANGMLQLSIWSGLRELGIGASLQHYNPIIDERIRQLFDLPESYVLVAQMPFGGMVSEPEPKAKEAISKRVLVL